MKYIKTYEDKKENIRYWKIRTDDPYLSTSLYKLKKEYGCTIKVEDLFNIEKNSFFKKNATHIYICNKEFFSQNTNKYEPFWYWSDIKSAYKMFGVLNKSTYMGEVEVTEDDIDEYNASQQAIKYNI